MPETRRLRPLALAASLIAASPVSLAAQSVDDGPLRRALAANRYTVELVDGRLRGPGGELLLEAGRAAQFFLLGEEHGVAETPLVAAALFRDLAAEGYGHLAIETGDGLAARLEEAARQPRPLEALARFYADHWPGAPFFTRRTEAELLVTAVRAVEGMGVLWGLDYDIIADRHALARLRELAATGAERRSVERAIQAADSAFERAMTEGNPGHVMMFGGPAGVLDSLAGAFDRRLWFEAWDRSGEPPRVLMKFGSNHMMKGRTPTGVFDIGTVAASIADALGRPSFHLLVVGGPGTLRAQLDTPGEKLE